jgi:methionyl-tRNA formyltransferase
MPGDPGQKAKKLSRDVRAMFPWPWAWSLASNMWHVVNVASKHSGGRRNLDTVLENQDSTRLEEVHGCDKELDIIRLCDRYREEG